MANNKFVQDIRKIVNVDPNQSTLPGSTPKSTLDGRRGIAYRSGDGATSSSQSGKAGVTLGTNLPRSGNIGQFGGSDKGSGNADESLEEEFGNDVDAVNPGNGSYNYNQGTYDIEDLIDGQGPKLANQNGQGVGNLPLTTGGTLNGLTGLRDLATNQPFELRMDGLPRPPEEWYSATDPGDALPEYDLWTMGKRWLAPSANTLHATPREAAVADRDFTGSTSYTVITGSNYISMSDIYQITFQDPGTLLEVTYQANGQACTPTSGSLTCPITSPLKWPSDNSMQLVLGDAKFRVAEQETIDDYITRFLDGNHSRIDFAFGSGREGSLRPAQGGGYLIGETTAGEYSSIVQHFDNKGKLIAYIAPSMTSSYEAR